MIGGDNDLQVRVRQLFELRMRVREVFWCVLRVWVVSDLVLCFVCWVVRDFCDVI